MFIFLIGQIFLYIKYFSCFFRLWIVYCIFFLLLFNICLNYLFICFSLFFIVLFRVFTSFITIFIIWRLFIPWTKDHCLGLIERFRCLGFFYLLLIFSGRLTSYLLSTSLTLLVILMLLLFLLLFRWWMRYHLGLFILFWIRLILFLFNRLIPHRYFEISAI